MKYLPHRITKYFHSSKSMITRLLFLLIALFFISALLHFLANKKILIQHNGENLANKVVSPHLVCNIELAGTFDYIDSKLADSTSNYLIGNLILTNRSNQIITPRGNIKVGVKWVGVASKTISRLDVYRIEFPSVLRPNEPIEFEVHLPILRWNKADKGLRLSILNEGSFWCSDHGGKAIELSRIKNNKKISIKYL